MTKWHISELDHRLENSRCEKKSFYFYSTAVRLIDVLCMFEHYIYS